MAGWEQQQWLEEMALYHELYGEKMDTSNVYPEKAEGEFLKKDDLKKDDGTYAAIALTIAGAELGEVEDKVSGGKSPQVVLVFQGKESTKKWGLNKTNWQTLVQMYGAESDNWVGKKIKIYVDPNVEYPKGTKIGGIRIQYEAAAIDDEIPF
jgi:hypothetical protein